MKRITLFLAVLCGTVVLLFASLLIQEQMQKQIQEDKLVDASFAEQGTPPLVAFTTVALGGFRGLIADILWIRMDMLQNEGKYYEMVQLADWVQILQPKFSGVSTYLAWNMAYNISVTCNDPADRWRWIHRAIETLNEAIQMNPDEPELYKELGWLYQHKLGNITDNAQRYYKMRMAKEMMAAYGSHYPDWKALAAAPRTQKELLALFPGEGSSLMAVLQKAGFENMNALEQAFRNTPVLPEKMRSVLPEKNAVLLENYLRANLLRTKYLLDPAYVVVLNEKYGDLDWLIPESFSLYWAQKGLDHIPDDIACQRIAIYAMNAMLGNGRILFAGKEVTDDFLLVPNPAIIPVLHTQLKDLSKNSESSGTFRANYQNFLKDAVVLLYSYGKPEQAYGLYQEYSKEFLSKTASEQAFVQFVLDQWDSEMNKIEYKDAHQKISALIVRACELLVYGDRDAAVAHLQLAAKTYDRYGRKYTDDRLKLPPFNEMKRTIANAMVKQFPDSAAVLNVEFDLGGKKNKNGEK